MLAALFAFYLPTSVATEISRLLSAVSIMGTAAFLLALLVLSRRTAPPLLLAVSGGMLGLLTVFTITSPFEAIAPGVVALYVCVAVLYTLDLRGTEHPALSWVFAGILIVSLAAGYALAADVKWLDRFAYDYYNAFYPALLWNMVFANDKPVLTFATHSVAGLMIYLLFYLQLKAFQIRGGLWRLAPAIGLLGLLILLRSTTGFAFGAVATAQIAWALLRSYPHRAGVLGTAYALGAIMVLLASNVGVATLYARAERALVGDRISGLFARYSSEGLLATNFSYLSESPLSPIGFSVTETLYLGDSGIVVNLLRGSVPLVVLVYGGLLLFLRYNLKDGRAALWIWTVVVLFEVGFTPLQYFRFVGFVPFMIMYLNSLHASPPVPTTAGAIALRHDRR